MTHIEQLAQQGYAEFPIPALEYKLLQHAMYVFMQTLEIQHENLLETQFLQHKNLENQTPLGYNRKELCVVEGQQQSDPKWYCHFHPAGRSRISDLVSAYNYNCIKEFLFYADKVYAYAQETSVTVLKQLEREGAEGLCAAYIRDGIIPNLILRFLAYDLQEHDGYFTARGHFDKSGGTIPLFETSSGLCIGPEKNGATSVVEWMRTKTIFMAGLAMKEYFGLTPGWHHVQQEIQECSGRGAIIAFIDPIEPYTVTEAEAH